MKAVRVGIPNHMQCDNQQAGETADRVDIAGDPGNGSRSRTGVIMRGQTACEASIRLHLKRHRHISGPLRNETDADSAGWYCCNLMPAMGS